MDRPQAATLLRLCCASILVMVACHALWTLRPWAAAHVAPATAAWRTYIASTSNRRRELSSDAQDAIVARPANRGSHTAPKAPRQFMGLPMQWRLRYDEHSRHRRVASTTIEPQGAFFVGVGVYAVLQIQIPSKVDLRAEHALSRVKVELYWDDATVKALYPVCCRLTTSYNNVIGRTLLLLVFNFPICHSVIFNCSSKWSLAHLVLPLYNVTSLPGDIGHA